MIVTSYQIRPFSFAGTTIQKPLAGRWSLEYDHNGQTCVFVEVNSPGNTDVAAAITPIGSPIGIPAETDPVPPSGYTALTFNAGTGLFSGHVPVPSGHSCAVSPPSTDNLLACVVVRDGGLWKQDQWQAVFKGVCETMFIDVPGRACPWFAFSDDSLTGPEGEQISTHKPVRIWYPVSATKLTITADGVWRHAPTTAATSGPNGYGNPQPMVNPNYKSSVYEANNISSPAQDPLVNTLVGLLYPNLGTTSAIFPIGTGPHVINLNWANDQGLFLGMWDGRQWNADISNSGTLSVTLEWEI